MANTDTLPQDSSLPTLSPSSLRTLQDCWYSSPTYTNEGLKCTSAGFLSVVNALLQNPNLNSSHLFRADILWDSAGELKTPSQLEKSERVEEFNGSEPDDLGRLLPADFAGFSLERTVVRRLIPRKPQLDPVLDQTCHIYRNTVSEADCIPEHEDCYRHISERWLVTYNPHISAVEKMPWYHPPVRALAFLFERRRSSIEDLMISILSLHVLPFDSVPLNPIPNRLHRTFLSLLSTYLRLCRNTPGPSASNGDEVPFSNPCKDNIIPQHIHQNTYTRLKETYAAKLIADWVEKTEPAKHVFEDLSIAAFLIELWRQMYKVKPNSERQECRRTGFPGFVDIACGNGVLVHVLLSEGYQGWGFDARSRKTWVIFPDSTQTQLKQLICLPRLFRNVLLGETETLLTTSTHDTHDGIFPKDTFIISNHADELTPWTPIMATLSNPKKPLPFLAIPCCSHALSGAKHRYSHPKQTQPPASTRNQNVNEQPQTGDLKALRAAKLQQTNGGQSQSQSQSQSHNQDSTYGSLCHHIHHLARELGFEVEKTLMRIPSTRNIGLLGRRTNLDQQSSAVAEITKDVEALVARECAKAGGIEEAARLFYERILGSQRGQGRGRVRLNLKGGMSGH